MMVHHRVHPRQDITKIRWLHVHQGNAVIVPELLGRDLLDLNPEELHHDDIFRALDLAERPDTRRCFIAPQERAQGQATGDSIRVRVMLNEDQEIFTVL